MHDSFLIKKISESISQICSEKNLARITRIKLTTSLHSHISKENLMEYLAGEGKVPVGEWTEIIIDRRDIDNLTAVIESIEGELFESQQ